MIRYTLGRPERLKSEKSISSLFETGISLSEYPIRILYRLLPFTEKPAIKVGFTVPKKNFKRAVDRNRLKRIMRESYRLNKSVLQKDDQDSKFFVEIMIIYQGQDIENYDKINKSILSLLQKLSKKL